MPVFKPLPIQSLLQAVGIHLSLVLGAGMDVPPCPLHLRLSHLLLNLVALLRVVPSAEQHSLPMM